ncbi:amidohydrolase family protein [Patulibacter sp. NPDC049589]|uniref:amidohydrolase family protein n=1 Tax=Patulibacter sp. NPDC049589 TaxID=3154731 RepID=UPI00342D5B35
MTTLLLTGGIGGDGARLDLRCDTATGLVLERGRALVPRMHRADAGESVDGDEGLDSADRRYLSGAEQVVDCTGLVLLPAPVEPHAHLDKALSGDAAPNPAGDLPGAIAAWRAHRATLDDEDLARRAREAALELVAHGTTTIRTHVDVGPGIGLRGLDVLVALREELRADGLCDLQLVALVTPPVTGPAGTEGAQMRALLREAMARGADVVGGCPHVDPDPVAATAELVAIADELGLPLDLHVDEQLAPGALWVRDLAAGVAARDAAATSGSAPADGAGSAALGPAASAARPALAAVRPTLGGRTVASHCVSLGVQDPETQARIAAELAAAGVAVVTLPQTNLYLQARDRPSSPPRGLTAIRALLDAGVVVAAGADNVRDPFNAVGRSDAMETAALLVMAAHLTPAEAWHAVSTAARAAIGLPATELQPGQPAEVLALRGTSLTDAMARASDERVVVHRGRVVASTVLTTVLRPLPAAASSGAPAGATSPVTPTHHALA